VCGEAGAGSGRPLPGVGAVGDGPVADRRDTDRLRVICDLVDDAIGPNSQRPESVEASSQDVSDLRVTLELSERVLDRIDHGPAEVEQLLSGAPREDDLGHASAGGPALGELATQITQCHAVTSR
jgi:hypothetical protein